MEKPAQTEFKIHDLLARRWSPRAFDERPVETDTLLTFSKRPVGLPLQVMNSLGDLSWRTKVIKKPTGTDCSSVWWRGIVNGLSVRRS